MKKYFVFIFGFMPFTVYTQLLVVLPVEQPPELVFEASPSSRDLTITKGDSVILGSDLKITGGSGSYSYRWAPGITLRDSTIMKPVARPEKNTTYVLTATDNNGCSFGISYQVTVKPATPSILYRGDRQGFNVWIYPNPGNGDLKIHITGKPARQVDLIVTDALGRVVRNYAVHGFEGNQVEELHFRLPSGVYTLLVRREGFAISRQIIVM
jgi:hypothetical protein